MAADLMNEDIQAQEGQAARDVQGLSAEPEVPHETQASFPEEAFPCPHCGQMLGPGVRVCVACRQPIDPSQIRIAAAAPPAAPVRAATPPKARFSWGIFLAALLAWLALFTSAIQIFGLGRAQFVMAAVLVISAGWVFWDARQKGIPRPIQWGAGALLFWIVFFPWYLARRRQPEASCPTVEAGTGPFLRVLLLILVFGFAFMLLFGAIASKLPK